MRDAINADLVHALVSDQFPDWGGLPVRPVRLDGWDNRTFRLGEELSVRLPTGAWYARQVAKEQRWLPILAPQLPLPIPQPVARGRPGQGYPYEWSVYRWLPGTPAAHAEIIDLTRFARDLAQFLLALGQIDPSGGPGAGEHNFYRGGPLDTYAEETHRAIAALGDEIDGEAAEAVWSAAMAATWHGRPVWFHGDIAVGNLLVGAGRLTAVIDFGTSGVGDPACDLAIAWTRFAGASRDTYRRTLGVDGGTWSRGRGWTIWKSLITLVGHLERSDDEAAAAARREISTVVADWQSEC